jgi:cysteine-rich repeat protein
VQRLALPLTILTSIPFAIACAGGDGTDSTSLTFGTLTTAEETGDGDGDTGDGDGDSGDGDGDTGDGDGDGEPGDGDGDTAMCGDGVTEAAEECDDGNPTDTGACTNACTNAVCGDGIVQEGVEMCDDGNDVDGDGCSPTCMAGSCGDGIPQPGELCDDGNADNTDECAGCQPASCGDGYVQAGVEPCDDGNDVSTDACISCVAATCGDGFVYENNEACDDGNDVTTDNCPACSIASCGDGFVLQGQESCDDGNNQPNDGCSPQCVAEADPQCFQPYNEFDDATRLNSFNDFGATLYCDNDNGGGVLPPDWAGPGWYRFTGAAGTQMATAAPGDYACATHASCWLDDPHPTPDEGVVQRTICADWSPGPCWQTWEISVVNCGNFYLYNLPNTIACNYRYCGRN